MKSISSLLQRQTPHGEAPKPETVKQITRGEVVGFVAENGAHIWRGIPYAASTAGANRWRAPQPVSPWKGRRTAVKFAPRCAQVTNRRLHAC